MSGIESPLFTPLDELTDRVQQELATLVAIEDGDFAAKPPEQQFNEMGRNLARGLDCHTTAILVHRHRDGTIDATATANTITLFPDTDEETTVGWVDDVIRLTEGEYANETRGLGRLGVQAAIDLLTQEGATTISLTSGNARGSAGRVYTDAGFEEGGEVWRVAPLTADTTTYVPNTDGLLVPLVYTTARCPIPIGTKPWIYMEDDGNSAPEAIAATLQAAKRDLAAQEGVTMANYCTEGVSSEAMRQALGIAGFVLRDTRLFTRPNPEA